MSAEPDVVDLGIPQVAGAVEIGAGGFGTVYRARQPALRRTVAVKVLHAALFDPRAQMRFDREIQAMGMLSGHPNIVTVFDSGFSSTGQPYILMDLMEGGSLAERVATEGPLPWEQVLDVTVKIAGALETAHQAGVLHRDIKPENILVSAYGEPKLGDFGIARFQGGPETRTEGGLTASIAHAAPEVIDGRPPSVASDLYALGSTMFVLLTGSSAFLHASDESIVPALARIATQPPPDMRPSGVPDAICTLVERLMAKSPDSRPPSAEGLGEAVRQLQREQGQTPTAMAVPRETVRRVREAVPESFSGETAIAPMPVTTPEPAVAGARHVPQPPSAEAQPQAQSPAPAWEREAQPGPRAGARLPGRTRGLVLAGGVVAALLGVGLVARQAPPPAPRPSAQAQLPQPTPQEQQDPGLQYVTLTDDTGALTVEVPAEWSDVDGSAWERDGDEIGAEVEAATDRVGFSSSWRVPGVVFGASALLALGEDPVKDLLTEVEDDIVDDRCTRAGREEYDDGTYEGFQDIYVDCGGINTEYVVVAAQPRDRGIVVLVQVQVPTERDRVALQRVMDTFLVTDNIE